MEDLLHLDTCRPKESSKLPLALNRVISPLRWQEWDTRLRSYPDQRLRAYIVEGICHGFWVGYNFNATCHHVQGNMKSAGDNPQVIQDYLDSDLKEGRIIGPLDPEEYPFIHTNRFGVMPKSTPGKWRLIVG